MKINLMEIKRLMNIESSLEDQAAVFLEEMYISGDSMIEMNHRLEFVEKDKQGSFYLYDLLTMFAQIQFGVKEFDTLQNNKP